MQIDTRHTVRAYDEELKYLANRLAAMGGHAERMVDQAVRALVGSDHALARNRWLVINLQRVIGVGMILFGILVVRGIVDLPQVAAYVFIAVGLIDVFLVPTILARRWRSPRQ